VSPHTTDGGIVVHPRYHGAARKGAGVGIPKARHSKHAALVTTGSVAANVMTAGASALKRTSGRNCHRALTLCAISGDRARHVRIHRDERLPGSPLTLDESLRRPTLSGVPTMGTPSLTAP
jgi:hypothetical protein